MRSRKIGFMLSAAVLVGVVGSEAHAQSAEEFYKGKQINFIIAAGTGGGYDTYGRVISRHLGKHLPGMPNVVSQNMPGADGIKATNHMYSIAVRDGLTLGNTYNTVVLEPLLGNPGVTFDPLKLNWVGSMGKQDVLCVTWHTSPAKTFEDAKKMKVRVSSTGATGNRSIMPKLFNALLGTQFDIIQGYDTGGAFLAVERGEVDGICGISLATLKAAVPHWLDGKLNFLVQFAAKKNPALPDVPMITDLVKDAKGQAVLTLVMAMQEIGRPVIAPPDLPDDRRTVLHKAFAATMKDPEFLAESDKLKLEIDPIDHAEIEALLKKAYASPKEVVNQVAEILGHAPPK